VMSRAIFEAPTIRPASSRIGEIVSATAMICRGRLPDPRADNSARLQPDEPARRPEQ